MNVFKSFFVSTFLISINDKIFKLVCNIINAKVAILWQITKYCYFFCSFLGFYAMIMMYIGFINGKFCRIFYPEDIKLPLALIVVSDISYGLLCYILMFLLRGRFHFPYYFTSVILPVALYTIVVTIILYPLILKINQKLEEKEKRSAHIFDSWNLRSHY